MFGYIGWSESGKQGKAISERVILHLRFAAVTIVHSAHTPAFLTRRRVEKAAKRLSCCGVSRAVFPEQFPYLEIFARHGILPVDPLPLYRALTAELVWAAMQKQELSDHSAIVAVCSDHLTTDVQRMVKALCIRCRYVLLSVPGEGETLCRQLRREYGVSLVLTEDPAQIDRADVLVLFAPREKLSLKNTVVLPLYRDADAPLPPLKVAVEQELPTDCKRTSLLAALWEAGSLRIDQIEIGEY